MVDSLDKRADTDHNRNYDKFARWCDDNGTTPFEVSDALLEQFYASRVRDDGALIKGATLKGVRTALHQTLRLASINILDEMAWPLSTQFYRTAKRKRPIAARYVEIWDPGVLIAHVKGIDHTSAQVPLEQLRIKTIVLLILSEILRPADLMKIGFSTIRFADDGSDFVYRIWDPKGEACARGEASGPESADWSRWLVCSAFTDDPSIDPVAVTRAYIARTAALRSALTPDRLILASKRARDKATQQLFFDALGSERLANLMKAAMTAAGIDTSVFKGASGRHASASNAINVGASVQDVMDKGRWTSFMVFHKFYNRAKEVRSTVGPMALSAPPQKPRSVAAGMAEVAPLPPPAP